MIVKLSLLKFSDRTFCILSNEGQCVVRIEAVVFIQLTKAHDITSTVGKQVNLHPPPCRPSSPLLQPSVRHC